MKRLVLFILCIVILSSCSAEIPRLGDTVTLECGELVFELSLGDGESVAVISEPETLNGMEITIGDSIICEYKGLKTVIPTSACSRITDAVAAAKAINNGNIDKKQSADGKEIFTYALDEKQYSVYYSVNDKKIIGFFADDCYYGVKD